MTHTEANFSLPRTVTFLGYTFIAAACFFGASLQAFAVLPLSDFARLSAILALGTVIGAVLQCGAAYSLPRAAIESTSQRDLAYRKTLMLTTAIGVITMLCAWTAPTTDFMRLGLTLGAAIGLQLVCDSYVRARGDLGFLGGLNASLHAAFLLSVFVSSLVQSLDPQQFVLSVVVVKLGFVAAVVARYGLPKAVLSRYGRFSVIDGVRGQSAVVIVFLLGTLDVLLIASLNPDASSYISFRHFAYGIFLVLIQESAVPILISRLVKDRSILLWQFALVGLVLAILVGITALVVSYILGMLRLDTPVATEILSCVVLSLSLHSLAVFYFFGAFSIAPNQSRLLKPVFAMTLSVSAVVLVLRPSSVSVLIGMVGTLNLTVAIISLRSFKFASKAVERTT